jgi:MerR family transcriptional regulator, light-induced transcriptional regulator
VPRSTSPPGSCEPGCWRLAATGEPAAGPRALLACRPGERHDLGLIAFGLVLRERGWRITFLGSDTPIKTIIEAAVTLQPAAVVLSAVTRRPFETVAAGIRKLAH